MEVTEDIDKALRELANKKNPHGYLLGEWGGPFCPHCGSGTNKHYRKVPDLSCWKCAKPIPVFKNYNAVEYLRVKESYRRGMLKMVDGALEWTPEPEGGDDA